MLAGVGGGVGTPIVSVIGAPATMCDMGLGCVLLSRKATSPMLSVSGLIAFLSIVKLTLARRFPWTVGSRYGEIVRGGLGFTRVKFTRIFRCVESTLIVLL